ncbi:polyamine ABC transporter substrate-binding protein [Snodgrassella alvi]|jgi:spermidine/putrescine-binding protein|uniref:polyamine ABC transporter substrate-binding protein n=1 Tax=Snodgrassella alvi TaxID=1196083 RepID=UPI000C1EE4D7|nr:polyamine ABC transporter substrate-binding protein [Snodgrassella alvi]PIT47398.1 polyamine ABC transporter substrate-binding protein [Snodgrassella alvi]
MKKSLVLSAIVSVLMVACSDAGNANKNAASSNAVMNPTDQLNIYNWSDYVDPDTVKAFEKENKIKVRYDYYDSNETLEAKILIGRSGYDLVVPSIANVGREIKAGAYQPVNKSQLSYYNNIDPGLLKMMDKVDPGNKYAVPYFWGMNTIGINTELVEKALDGKLPDNLWDLVFNPIYTHKLKSCGISLFDSPTELYPLALHYLGKDPNSSSPDDIRAATNLIKSVRNDVKRFSSSGYIDDMARGDLCVATGYGGDLNIAKKRAEDAKSGVHLQVLAPKEGVGIWIDSFMIPKDAQNVANALKYINYTLDPKVAAKNGNYVTFAPASKPARALMNSEISSDPSIFPTQEVLDKSFVVSPKSQDAVRLAVRLFQQVKAGQ